jgi:hypothetical protein
MTSAYAKSTARQWLAESKLPRLMWPAERGPPTPRLRRDSLRFRLTTAAKTGGKGIRTPDIQLAKLALYQLSYAPEMELEPTPAFRRLQW